MYIPEVTEPDGHWKSLEKERETEIKISEWADRMFCTEKNAVDLIRNTMNCTKLRSNPLILYMFHKYNVNLMRENIFLFQFYCSKT